MIISIGYRVNSQKATHFRQRATNVLKQYLVQGFALNNSRLRQTGFAELQRAQKYKAFHREQKDWKMRV